MSAECRYGKCHYALPELIYETKHTAIRDALKFRPPKIIGRKWVNFIQKYFFIILIMLLPPDIFTITINCITEYKKTCSS